VNLQIESSWTVLKAAAAAGNSTIVGSLLHRGAKPAIVGNCQGPAIQASETGHSDVMEQFVSKGVIGD
jgi:hypothetical protein